MKKLILSALFVLLYQSISANTATRTWSCQTREQVKTKSTYLHNLPFDTDIKQVNIYIHIIRDSDGEGGLSTSDVNRTLEILIEDFKKANIQLQEIGREDINNSLYKYSNPTEEHFDVLVTTNRHTNAIDLYLLPESNPVCSAVGIPSTALVFGGYKKNTSIISHELGHCLGLYHTHAGNGCGDYSSCTEDIDGQNSSICGDGIDDTPADPCLMGNVDKKCRYTGEGEYDPLTENIMSYTCEECMNSFSQGQMERMHDNLTNIPLLQALRTKIKGPARVAYNSEISLYIENMPEGSTLSWENYGVVQRLSPQGSNPGRFVLTGHTANPEQLNISATILQKGQTFALKKTLYTEEKQITFDFHAKGREQHIDNGEINHDYYCEALGEACTKYYDRYQWTITSPSNLETYGGNDPDFHFIPTEKGIYTVTLEYKYGNGKVSTGHKHFEVSFSPSILIQPNPAHSQVCITLSCFSKEKTYQPNFTYKIVDQRSHLKQQGVIIDNKADIKVSDLEKGVYFVFVRTESNIFTEKLIIS